MEKKKELLEAMRKMIELDENYHIETVNKRTNHEGTATILNDGETIRVFEGSEDGSDDKNITTTEFINNYDFIIRWY